MRSVPSPIALVRALGAVFLLFAVLALACAGCSSDAIDDSISAEAAATQLPVKRAAAKLAAAIEKKDEMDARLGRALARVGPMLTVDQSRSFIRAFESLPDVREVATDYHESAVALDAELTRILATDGAIAAMGYRPADIFDSYALLASSPSASGALSFAVRLLARDPRLAAVKADDADVVDRILIPALPGTYLEKLFKTGSNREATAQTQQILTAGGSVCATAAGWLGVHNRLAGNDPLVDTILISGRSLGESLRTVSAIMAIWELGGDLARGDVDAALASFLSGGPHAISGVAAATSLFRRVLLGIDETPLAAQVMKYAGRLASGIGAIANLLALIESTGHWSDNAAAKVRVAGDLIALGGSVLMLVGATPAGMVLATLAIGVHLLADWLEQRAIDKQERLDLLACLPQVGLSEVMVERVVDAHPALVRILAETVKLAPADLQWLMGVYPEAVASSAYQPLQYIGVQVAQNIFDLDGAETKGMLAAVIGAERDPQRVNAMLDTFLRGLEYGQGWNGDISKAAALAWLDSESASTMTPAGERALRTAAFRNGRAYLATK